MSNLKSLLMSVSMLAAVATGAVAQEQKGKLEEVLARGELIVGTGSTNAPWHFMNDKGELVGFDIAISHILAKGLFDDPNKVRFVDQSSDSRIPNLVAGKVDIVCQFLTVTAQRALQVDFTIPYYREGGSILLAQNSKFKDYDALRAAGKDVTVSILQNPFAEEFARKALPDARVDQYESADLLIQAVNSGRVDAGFIDASSLQWLMRQQPGQYRDAGFHWQPQSYACAVKKGDPEFLNWVNTALHEAMTGVEFDAYSAAFKEYFGTELQSPALGMPVEYR